MSLNYFAVKEQYDLPPGVFTNAVYEVCRKGWETGVRVKIFQREDFMYQAGIMFSTINIRYTGEGTDFISGPSQRSQLFNKLTLKRIVLQHYLNR